MTKKLTRPSWYNAEFYNKSKTPEEWLWEFWKREQFNRDEIGLPYSMRILSIKEQEKHFVEFIFEQQIEKMLRLIEATPSQPIRYPSVNDIFIMYYLLTNTDWYKNNPSRDAFESAISIITNEGLLSREQMRAFS